jgi:hypothetical protein
MTIHADKKLVIASIPQGNLFERIFECMTYCIIYLFFFIFLGRLGNETDVVGTALYLV